ncbi:hypothetical protein SAMN05444409_1822 [Epilithonimonas zeae]|uniref:Uncharacterized protein n=1 Tax=Epilithonimonas zeae TaxID=1416779 RepID=A0A1N6GFT3_9FLAO|nr:hypothetical protein SAMN05444409_1822 [Epilithonimonas zeae]
MLSKLNSDQLKKRKLLLRYNNFTDIISNNLILPLTSLHKF